VGAIGGRTRVGKGGESIQFTLGGMCMKTFGLETEFVFVCVFACVFVCACTCACACVHACVRSCVRGCV
jgi:hypothetical protein